MYPKLFGFIIKSTPWGMVAFTIAAATLGASEFFFASAIGLTLSTMSQPKSTDGMQQGSSIIPTFLRELPQPELISLAIVSFIVASILRIFLARQIGVISFGVTHQIVRNLYDALIGNTTNFYASNKQSRFISDMTTKCSAVAYNTLVPLLTIVMSVLMLVVPAVYLLDRFGYLFILSFLLIGTMIGIIIYVIRSRIQENSRFLASTADILVQKAMSHYLSAIDILVYRLKGEFMRSYTVTDLAFRKAQQLNQFYGQVPKMSLEIISGFVLIASVVFILQAPSLAERSGVLITEILALLLLAQKLLPTFNSLYSGIITIYGGNAFVLDLMPFISRGCSAACDTKNTEHITKGGYPLGVDGHLEVLGLNINIGNSPILRDLNFVIAGPGKINLIAGPSGSGKTTLLGFLIGLVPDARYSEVRLINGTSTIILRGAPFSYDDVAYCQQSCYVFPATLRYNICLDDDFVLEKYNKVIRLLELEDLDARFGNQLISEGAYELSGGQRLRIGLARAIYKNRPILVLDEPTAALDEEFGLELVRRLTKGFPSTIIIIVSHQIALRKVASNIIELK